MRAQTFTAWEMICINDGSRDATAAMLDEYAAEDPRIRVVHQDNQGVTRTLNRGLALAQTPLIARMDADDIAMPDRLRQQVSFMDSHPRHVAVGGAILKIDNDSDRLGVDCLATEHTVIEAELLQRRTGMFHPTVMMRREVVQRLGGYRPECDTVEDHDLWLRLARVGQLANLQAVVLCYRLHPASVCWQKSDVQRQRMNQLLAEAYADRGLAMPGHLNIDVATVRSPGGPGKWARMAARGYAPKTAMKHLVRLWREPGPVSYRLRMTFETLTRIVLSLPRLPLHTLPSVPQSFLESRGTSLGFPSREPKRHTLSA
jgi:hypothetical protein